MLNRSQRWNWNCLNSYRICSEPRKSLRPFPSIYIVKFLVWKDGDGRTVAHKTHCKFLGLKCKTSCDCPKHLTRETVDSVIGKLRSIFSTHDRVGDWNAALGIGNPAASKDVKDYLSSITAEQLQARVTPLQTTPSLLSDVEILSSHIFTSLLKPMLEPRQVYMLARDQAFFKALFFSGDRAADLALVTTQEIVRFPDNTGFLFNHLWSKTLRQGDQNVFALRWLDRVFERRYLSTLSN